MKINIKPAKAMIRNIRSWLLLCLSDIIGYYPIRPAI